MDEVENLAKVDQARILAGLGRYAAAEALLRRVIADDPDHFEAILLLAWTLMMHWLDRKDGVARDTTEGAWLEDPLQEALTLVGMASAIRPYSVFPVQLRARILAASGRRREAKEVAREAIRRDRDPTDHIFLTIFGRMHLNLGEFEEAMGIAERLKSLDPDGAIAHEFMASLLGDLGRLDEAVKEAELAVRLGPGSSDALTTLAYLLFRQGRLDEAEGLFLQALRLHPRTPYVSLYLGRIGAERARRRAAAQADRSAPDPDEPSV